MTQITLEAAKQLIRQTNGRATPARLEVLLLLLQSPTALSHVEIEQHTQQLGLAIDRVTLYRILEWLVENGLAHKISSFDRVWRYNAQIELCCPHAHFACKQCKQVLCLTSLQAPYTFELPTGFLLESMDITLTGLCADCSMDTNSTKQLQFS